MAIVDVLRSYVLTTIHLLANATMALNIVMPYWFCRTIGGEYCKSVFYL